MTDNAMEDQHVEAEEDCCMRPCNPASGCAECSEYWYRMVTEGFWDHELGRWTERGWREMMK